MSPSGRAGVLGLALAMVPAGCGTIANVTAPTTPRTSYRAFGPTACEPFGGVQRSVMVGSAPLMAGWLGVIPAVVAVGVDTPLSLVGDVLTLPIVYARLHWTPHDGQGATTHDPEPPAPVEGPPQHAPASIHQNQANEAR
jgi:hypothetical protein